MKKILLSFLCLGFVFTGTLSLHAQEDKTKRPSPPAEAIGKIGDANIAVYYSSPAVKGREIWGALVPYNKIWRTGANEATIFETDQPIALSGNTLPAGKYALFTIPGETGWTVVFNSEWNQWGAFKYDETKDVLRIKVAAEQSPVFNERLRFDVLEDEIALAWENTRIAIPVGM